jgi:hypothetical protein
MSKLKQVKIPVTVGLDNLLKVVVEQGALENEFNWNLIREGDSLTKKSKDIKWLEFNEDGTYKEQFQKADIGRSLIMSPFNNFFTWQTTPITEIIEERIGGYVKFKTGNSTYELSKIYSEPEGNPI